MTNKRTFDFSAQRPASDYEETAELPVQIEPPLVTVSSDTDPMPASEAPIFEYGTDQVVEGNHFAEAPRYQQLSSYERLLNMLWYEKRRDFLTVIAALGLLVLGVSAFVLLLKDSPAFETAIERTETSGTQKSTFFFPPAGPAIASTNTTSLARSTQSKPTNAPTTVAIATPPASAASTASSISSLDALLLEELNQTIEEETTTLSKSATTKEQDSSTTVATTTAPASTISSQKVSLDATLTKINFSGNFCASAYTLTLASEERSLDRTVDKSAEECSTSWPAYFTGLTANQEYQLTIGAAHKETGEIIYSSTSFVAE